MYFHARRARCGPAFQLGTLGPSWRSGGSGGSGFCVTVISKPLHFTAQPAAKGDQGGRGCCMYRVLRVFSFERGPRFG